MSAAGGMSAPVRRLRRALLAKVRRGLLERWAGKWPLMKAQIVAEEVAKRPGYYAGGEEEAGAPQGGVEAT